MWQAAELRGAAECASTLMRQFGSSEELWGVPETLTGRIRELETEAATRRSEASELGTVEFKLRSEGVVAI